MDTRPTRGALAAVLLGYFVVMLDTTIVNVALPRIGADLGAQVTELQWVADAYTIVFAALLLGAGSACDRMGARRVYVAGLLLFAALSAGCALAPSIGVLIAARAVQGVGAAAIVPGSLALITETHPGPGERSRTIGLWGGAGGIAAAAGPVLGGMLVETAGWRAVFWVNLPVIAVTCHLVLRRLPAVSATLPRGPVDHAGQILAIAGLGTLAAGIITAGEEGLRPAQALLLVTGVLLLAGFALVEKHHPAPMLPLSLFTTVGFGLPVLAGFALNLGFFGQLFVLSLFFQQHLGYPPWLAGLALAPQACSAVVAAPLGGRAAARIGPSIAMLLGLATGAAGFASLVLVDERTPYPAVAVLTFIAGCGVAFAVPAATSAAITGAPAAFAGLAGGASNAARQTGSVLGVALLGALVAGRDFLSGFHLADLVAAGILATAGAFTSVLMLHKS